MPKTREANRLLEPTPDLLRRERTTEVDSAVLAESDTIDLPADSAASAVSIATDPVLIGSTLEKPSRSKRSRAPWAPNLDRGEIIGRYVVFSKLGAGAMGVVFAAYDPDLDRKVALKLLRARPGDQRSAQARLAREAQSLARLNHRNVVSVYDVGVHEGQLFVAMELVAGQTLREWMAAGKRGEPRSWRDTLSIILNAGRGLAAAHGAGLVHRDFKPDNVMLGEDGRVRVMDFGLARNNSCSEHLSNEGAAVAARTAPTVLTQTGTLLGTPAYMAPEQLERQPADAQSDQFSFCVVLYEALYGQRPYSGRSLDELLAVILRHETREEPGEAAVPPWLHRVVLRGLSPERGQRFESMEALLDALSDDPALRRRKWGLGGAAVGLVSAAVGLGWMLAPASSEAPERETCDSFVAQLDDYWSPERSVELGARISQPEVANHALAELERLATQWRVAAREDCQGEHAPAPDSDDRQCMEAWLQSFDRITRMLGDADPEQLARAPDLLARLSPLVAGDYCTIQPDLDVDPEVAERAQFAREAAAFGDFERGRAEANAALAAAGEPEEGYTRGRAEALAASGEVLAFADQHGARDQLRLAQAHARATVYLELELDVILLRVKLAVAVGDYEVAATLLEQVEPLERLLSLHPEDPRKGEIFEARGWYERGREDYDAAIEHHRRSRAIFEAAGRRLAAAKAVLNVGACQQEAGDYEEAKRSYEEAWRMFDASGVAPSFRNFVEVEYSLGLLAFEVDDPEGVEHLDTVISLGSPAKRLTAMALAIGLEENTKHHELAVARAKAALTELDGSPKAPREEVVSVLIAAGQVLSTDNLSYGLELLHRAEREARELELYARYDVQRNLLVLYNTHGRCEEAAAQLEALAALVREPGGDTFASDLETARTESCETLDGADPIRPTPSN